MKEVWYFAMLQGAILWQYSQDKKRKLPEDFTRGLDGISKTLVTPDSLQFLLGANMVLIGLYDEILDAPASTIDNTAPILSTSHPDKKKREQKPPSSKKVK